MTEVRSRFAPSPTGYLHLGSARTALYSWMFARQTGGKFLLRIEDTDPERSKPELIDVIFNTLTWLGLDWDEEPIFQSERNDIYHAAIQKLVDTNNAYFCNCSQEDVKTRTENNPRPGYDRYCRDRGLEDGPSTVVRFRTPDEGTTAWQDRVYGDVSFANVDIEDFVIRRSDKSPMFFVPNAVDEIEQGVTHILRGQDLINVTPKMLLIRNALGVTEEVVWAHLPLIVNEARKKLSKRVDDVSIESYKDRGFLPEAMRNYLALLGWGPREGEEIQPIEEMIKQFDLADINSSPAAFDIQKLTHINGEYIRKLSLTDFIKDSQPYLQQAPWPKEDFRDATFARMAPLVQERVKTMSEVADMVDFFFMPEVDYDESAWNKVMVNNRETAVTMLNGVREVYATIEWTSEVLHDETLAVAEKNELKLGKAQAPIRLAITGRTVGPPLFESLEALGREETLRRIDSAVGRL